MDRLDTEYHHSVSAQLRFSDVDRFGHVNNSVYFSLFDMCKSCYFADVFGRDFFSGHAPVVAHIDANFLSPVYYPDEIAIETAVVRVGNKSFTVRQRAYNERTCEIKCECETVMVMMNPTTMQSVEVSDAFRERVEMYENLSK